MSTDGADPAAERIARNDATFRQANERIEQAALEVDMELLPFICECADVRCTDIVRLTLQEYEAVRSNGRLFFNGPGHQAAAGRWVCLVERHERYVLVEKVGDAGRVAEELDPRQGVAE